MRGKKPKVREIKKDYKYSSELVTRFINLIMWQGKKTIAEKIVYNLMDNLEKKLKKPALEIVEECLSQASPPVILKAKRLGGANIQIPIALDDEKGKMLALRWIITAARKRTGDSMSARLEKEFVDITKGVGDVLKKKEEAIKMAEANKAFSHIK